MGLVKSDLGDKQLMEERHIKENRNHITFLTITVGVLLAIAIGIGAPYLMRQYSIKYAVPAICSLLLLFYTLIHRDPQRMYLYILMAVLPVFITFYLVELPDILPDHSGLLAYPAVFAHDLPFWALTILLLIRVVWKKPKNLVFPGALLPLALLLIPGFISTLSAEQPELGYFELMRSAKMIFLAFLVANVVEEKRHLFISLGIIFIGLFLQDVIAFLQFIQPEATNNVLTYFGIYPNLIGIDPGDPDSASRICGTTGYCNALAGYMELVLPIALALVLLSPVSKRIRNGLWVLMIVSLVIFYLTYSRGGFIGMILALGVVMLIWARRHLEVLKKYIWLLILIGVVIIIVANVIGSIQSQRLEETGGFLQDKVRIYLIFAAINMIAARPFFGIGINNFSENLNAFDYSGTDFEMPYPVHNTFLLSASETGLIGLFMLVWFFWRALRAGIAAIKRVKDPYLVAIGIGIFAGLTGWLVHNMAAPLYQNWIVNRLTLMVMVGFIYAIPCLGGPSPASKPDMAMPSNHE